MVRVEKGRKNEYNYWGYHIVAHTYMATWMARWPKGWQVDYLKHTSFNYGEFFRVNIALLELLHRLKGLICSNLSFSKRIKEASVPGPSVLYRNF